MTKNLLTAALLLAGFLTGCKKDKEGPAVQFSGTANEVSGEWMMNPVTVTGEPSATIVPKYQFGTNMRYTFVQGLRTAPRSESGEYMVVQRPPIGFYVLVLTPEGKEPYNLELHIQSPTSAMFGARLFHKVK